MIKICRSKLSFNVYRLAIGLVILFALFVATYYTFFHQGSTQHSREVNAVLQKSTTQVFEPVLPGTLLSFPKDFVSHPSYQHEWWYINANVNSADGQEFGIQWTLFRFATADNNDSGWQSPQMYMSHVVITSEDKKWAEQRFARGGIGQAGVRANPFRAWIDNWSWSSPDIQIFPSTLRAASDDFSFQLHMDNAGPIVLQGDKGYSQKHDQLPIASHYFSMPFLKIEGALVLDGQDLTVKGDAWLDREWGSGMVDQEQQGWDWFSFHLDDGRALMVSQYRHNFQQPHKFGSISEPSGSVTVLTHQDIRMTPLQTTKLSNGRLIPLQWMIDIPKYGINLTTQPVRKEQWLPFLIPYWEGPIHAVGSHTAKGFMELTGY
ncbi:carotenoid 1,2-hydratase [Vibrio sp. Of7-15]|uniref:lipocalin-like domain-containing protein n=1 Tax=Vibrio sp. Of7-15 TaxID=2724879 RepID=UPI001EF3CB81|nr:lipocalin-like domain-containing protein [Vibrio sp. Of7-15]MCG7497031.1 carotenoid 1,2-hydratase [Vibrio sp. Of7-15]